MKKLSFLLLAALCSLGCNAQLLWKISGNGLKAPSYIFGTHHVAPATITDDIKGYKDAFAGCGQCYGEVDMSSMMQDAQTLAPKYMIAPQDSTLNKIYSAEDLKYVDNAVQKYLHIGVEQISMLKPAALGSQISMCQAMAVFKDFDPNKQLDGLIQKEAKEQGKDVKGLETVEYQLNILFNSPIAEQAKDLLKMVKDEDKYAGYSKILADLYLKQDLEGMYKLMQNPDLGMTEKEAERLLYSRNDDWMKQLPSIMAAKGTFIAVGSGHLAGDRGVLQLLRKAGYKVTPVK